MRSAFWIRGVRQVAQNSGSRSLQSRRNAFPGRMIAMTKWEYATVPLITHATKQILDTWGEDGWELVSVLPGMNPENLVAYMKREVA